MAVTDPLDFDGRLRPPSLVELAVSRLRGEILSGALEPGERLVEEQLTRRFGISRAPVREALCLLAEQGLVDHLPRRGVRVTTLSERDYDELFAVRNALEQFAIQLLLDQSSGVLNVNPLADILDQLAVAADSGDRLAASRAHQAFHLALVALADSRQLVLTYEPVLMKLQLYMAANLRREAEMSSPAEGVRRHRRLLRALSSGDREKVRIELQRHGSRSYFR